jgi:ribosomal protein L19E
MVSLRLQKRLAASVLKCGKRKIWCVPCACLAYDALHVRACHFAP